MLFDIPSIKLALPIGLVLESRGVRLRRGRGPCPICGTSDRSSAFSTRDGRWRCFACNEHGDVVDLVAKLDQVSLREAIRHAAALAGISPGRCLVRPQARPKSAWQLAREERERGWHLLLNAVRERERAAKQYERAVRRWGVEHGLAACFGEILAEAYDQEMSAEYGYGCAMEMMT